MTFYILIAVWACLYIYLLFGEHHYNIFIFKMLYTDEPDDFVLECVRWLNADNLFAVNLTIHLSEYLANEGVVSSFVILLVRDAFLEDGNLDEDTTISLLPVIHFKFLKFTFISLGNNHCVYYMYALFA